ncbi:MAG: ABC transporter ATP-binding protein [Roseivirga sp.]
MIHIEHLSKHYELKGKKIQVLQNVSLQVQAGELVALIGQSGAGKSTLLNILGILDTYDEGSYYLQGHLIKGLTEDEAARYRNQLIGFIFQRFHLIPTKTALDNVALPLYYRQVDKSTRQGQALAMLDKVGLADKHDHLPNELSGGQQQRVAIARALIADPPLILADEPTGALDSKTSQEIFELLKALHQAGKTVLIVTHNKEVADQCNRIITIKDGSIV